MRKCKVCKKTKALKQFAKNEDFFLWTCRVCYRKAQSKRFADYHAANTARINEAQRRRYVAAKRKVFEHYGNCCACCGENEPLFLTVDHVDNDGWSQRRGHGKSSHNNIYAWLVKECFPLKFQILCSNCNHGKHRNGGVCPHVSKALNDQSIVDVGPSGSKCVAPL